MATTGCASAGSSTLSSMKQLHPLTCRSQTSIPLPHPCKLVFFFYLPTRLNTITSTRKRLPLSPPFCSHGELEIISVKELADGFLHFSFGAPSSASKGDELSSSSGEHVAGKLSIPQRLPSKFSKKSPIPVAAARRRTKQGESSSKEGSAEAIPPSVQEAVKLSLRPKSSFVKRSPIPKGKSEHLLGIESVSNGGIVHDKGILMPPGTKLGSIKVGKSMRPTSIFVKRSPIPSSVSKDNGRPPPPFANSDASPNKVGKASEETASVSTASRPKSIFSRRSPIVNVQHLSPKTSSTRTASVSTASRPKSIFSRRSPIVKVQHLSPKTSSTRRGSSPKTPSHKDSSKVDDSLNREVGVKSPKTPEELPVDLENCKLPELRNLAKMKGVRGYSKLKKGELLNLLKNLDS